MRRYIERIVFKDDNFMIERSFPDKQKPHEFLPVSEWHFVKNCCAIALVKRQTENLESLDEPSNVTFYEIAVSFDVADLPISRSIYLKTEQTKKIISENLRVSETYTRVYVKNLENGILQEAQFEDSESFPFNVVKVSKSRPKRVTYERAKELLKSGQLLGIFNDKELSEVLV
ncbi:hypothetical protein MUP01_13995 [Candidatus Bathyarchaeota archaeon]|nr:hypothetical protein [Candidatus Bathyarchaeota archaeon]